MSVTEEQKKYSPEFFPIHLSVSEKKEFKVMMDKVGWRCCKYCDDYFVQKTSKRRSRVCEECKKSRKGMSRVTKFWQEYDKKWPAQ